MQYHYKNTSIQIYYKFYHQKMKYTTNILQVLPPKNENFPIKNSNIFFSNFCLKGSNEYPQSMFLNRNKKNNVYLCKPQFY